MASSLLEEIVADDVSFVCRLNVDQLHQMLAAGVIYDGAPVELIDGLLVYKDRGDAGGKRMSHGPKHATVVNGLGELEKKVSECGFHVRTQLPVTLSDISEPEPDAAIVRGDNSSYTERHPTTQDVAVVIEVAETSLRRDQTTKQRVYSKAGIPTYLIVNLNADEIELYQSPIAEEETYRERRTLSRDDTLFLQLGDSTIEVQVADLLP
ncbi:MAG: Uma2 family endonuclease [Planctomycetota bacterium]|nr:Uma2 family endonuclease [Planctomycetota bacterium]